MERNQRPLTVALLLRLKAEFGVDVQLLSDDSEARLIADLRDILGEQIGAGDVSLSDIKTFVANTPSIGLGCDLRHAARLVYAVGESTSLFEPYAAGRA